MDQTMFQKEYVIYKCIEFQPAAPAYYKAKEYNPETAVDPLVKPIGASTFLEYC